MINLPVKLHCRLWLEHNGDYVIGPGAIALLQRIHMLGSLKKAAEALNMPYRGAWGRIRKAEKSLGIPLLSVDNERHKGMRLTPEAIQIVKAFVHLNSVCQLNLTREAKKFPYLDVEQH